MGKLLRICILVLPVLVVIMVNTKIAQAAVIFQENFEYSQNTTNCATTQQLNGWKWDECNDDSTNPSGAHGNINISSIHANSGSRSLLEHFQPIYYQCGSIICSDTDPYVGKFASYGDDIWLEQWLYLAYEPGMYSEFHNGVVTNDSKWIYMYQTGQSGQSGAFACFMMNGQENWIYPPNYTLNGQFPNWHTGIWSTILSTCAQTYMGENLYSGQTLLNNRYYIPVNTWTRSIIHLNTHYVNSSTPNVEVWVDNGRGLVKTNEYAYSWDHGLDSTIGRILFGTTWTSEAWVFVDNIKIATSRNDFDWTSSSNPPPSPPQNLTVQ